MKRWIFWSIASVLTFVFGCAIVFAISFLSTPITLERPLPLVAAEPTTEKVDDFIPEIRDLPTYDELEYPDFNKTLLDIKTQGDIFLPEDVVAKTGESWLALVRKNDGFVIENIKARVRKYSSPEMGSGNVRLSFGSSSKPVFAVRDLKFLSSGSVSTLYYQPLGEIEDTVREKYLMRNGYRREFNLNGSEYEIRVAKGLTNDGEKIGVLLLRNGDHEQVIDRSPYYTDTELNLGGIIWAGDLDRDGKLDLYIDRSLAEEKSGTGLFLSSHANAGDLVKLVALFGHTGC